MFVLGLQGSPRKKGNTNFLLSAFMEAAEKSGAETHVIDATRRNIEPCKELIVCEKKGYCPIKDDMNDIYPLLRRAEVVVLATPVFFYNTTAQLKALIDRSQTLWARTYKLNLKDPGSKARQGFMLAVGATKGKNLFEGLHLTAKYFFDAVGASYAGSLTYRQIEHPGDMEKHPQAMADVNKAVSELLTPLLARRKILFVCRDNAGRSQMAEAFAKSMAGDKIDVRSAGVMPAERLNPLMVAAMQEKGIDMEFLAPRSLESLGEGYQPDSVIFMDGEAACPTPHRATVKTWDIPDLTGKPMSVMRSAQEQIETQVRRLLDEIKV